MKEKISQCQELKYNSYILQNTIILLCNDFMLTSDTLTEF